MSTFLHVHCYVEQGTLFGHSWIECCPADGYSTTYGTWGNNPNGAGNGMFENVEHERYKASHTRTAVIDDDQMARLRAVIERYRAAGTTAWSLTSPCSAFASEAWEAATGEHLAHRTASISNPGTLARSITAANQAERKQTADSKARLRPPEQSKTDKPRSHSAKRKKGLRR